jgi:nucleoid-associated protein YgaU
MKSGSTTERQMGLFDKDPEKKEKPKADFSNVQGGSSSTAPRDRVDVEVRRYTVVSGDSLSRIAKREYGDAQKWRQIYEANREHIKDPDLIYPGQVLTIPAEK